MTKGAELSPKKKSVIVALSKEELSSRQIASRVGFHQSTVAGFLIRYDRTGSTDRI